jgi:hypothetical protein
LARETAVLEENPPSVLCSAPQLPHKLSWEQIRAAALTCGKVLSGLKYTVFIVQTFPYTVPRDGIFLSKWRSSFGGSSGSKMNVQSACALDTQYKTTEYWHFETNENGKRNDI